MKPTRRTSSVLITGLIAASLAFAGGAGASAPKITETFDSGSEGWEIYEGTSEYGTTWQASGGNPGGYVSYSDAGSSDSDAVFTDEDYVSHIGRYIGGVILFDLRSDAADPGRPLITITDPGDYDFPAIHTRADRAPGADWTSYGVRVDADDATWRDEDGDRVGAKRFERILDRDPVYEVQADYSASAPETTDLDNVGITSAFQRTLKLTYSPKKGKFKGVLKCDKAPDCAVGQKVTILKRKKGPDPKLGTATTSDDGRYSLKRKKLPKGTYYAKTPESRPDPGTICLSAKSPAIKRK